MSEINLETTEPVGIIKAFTEGLTKFFENFIPVIKMSSSALITVLGIVISICSSIVFVIVSTFNNNLVFSIALGVSVLLIGIIIFCYGFWKWMLSLIGVSYLAKDVYENKELKTAKTYMGYVEKYSKDYIKFLLYLIPFQLVPLVIFFAYMIGGVLLCEKIHSLFSVGVFIYFLFLMIAFIIPYYLVINYSPLFWAYQDKTKPFDAIKNSFLVVKQNFFKVFLFQILLGIVSQLFYAFVQIITAIPSFIADYLLESENALLVMVGFVIFIFALVVILSFTLLIQYFCYFVMTRYYFEMIKNKGLQKK